MFTEAFRRDVLGYLDGSLLGEFQSLRQRYSLAYRAARDRLPLPFSRSSIRLDLPMICSDCMIERLN